MPLLDTPRSRRQRLKSGVRAGVEWLDRPWLWCVFSAIVLAVDFLTGPLIQFPVFFILPVSLAAWHRGFWLGAAFAAGLPLVRYTYNFVWESANSHTVALINLLLRSSVLLGFAFLVGRTARQTRELEREVKVLEGILPTCANCKKIRDKNNQWHPIEVYISSKSEARFSHGFCPECAKRLYGEYLPPNYGMSQEPKG